MRSATPHTKRGAEREAEILEAAARIFSEQGYPNSSISDIANAVGLLKGSLYHYINSKEELLFRVIYDHHKESLEATRLKLIGLKPVDAIRAYVAESVLYVAMFPSQSAVFYSESRHLTGEHRSKILTLRDESESILHALINKGQQSGTVRSDFDARLLAIHVIGSITSLPNWYRLGGRWSPEMIADAYADLALTSLTAPGNDLGPSYPD